MSDELRYLVPFRWTSEMDRAVLKHAAEFAEDREKRAFLVGVIYLAWPLLLEAAIKDHPPA